MVNAFTFHHGRLPNEISRNSCSNRQKKSVVVIAAACVVLPSFIRPRFDGPSTGMIVFYDGGGFDDAVVLLRLGHAKVVVLSTS
jgi:hypothetical protein